MKKLEIYMKEGKIIKNKYKQTTYIFNFPIKEKKAKMIDSYKFGDIIGNKQITNIFEVNNEKRFMMKCLRCSKIREYHTDNLDKLYTNKYCINCRDRGKRKEVEYKGQIFGSMADLANYLGLDISTVSRHLKRNGNLDTLGRYRLGDRKYKVGNIIGNKQIISEEDDKHVKIKCLNCGEVTKVAKTYILPYCKRKTCKYCHTHKSLKYKNIKYKGNTYRTVQQLIAKTNLKRVTVNAHLKKYGNLNNLTGRILERYKVGDIVNGIKILEIMKNTFRVECLKCKHNRIINKSTLYSYKNGKHTYRCLYCNLKKKVNVFKNKYVKSGTKVKYKGKTYISMHELARKLGISPGKVIGQYHRHNGDLSGLRIK